MTNLLIFCVWLLAVSLLGQYFIRKFGPDDITNDDLVDPDNYNEEDEEKYL